MLELLSNNKWIGYFLKFIEGKYSLRGFYDKV